MIQGGRWVLSLLFAAAGIAQMIGGVAYLMGWVKPDLQHMTLPPGTEAVVVQVVGLVSTLTGLLFAVTAWGIFQWRWWARMIAIVLGTLQLLAIVVLSFIAPLPAVSIASGMFAILMLIWLFNSRVQAAFKAGGPQA